MGNAISGIIIQKSSFSKDTKVEECEMMEGKYIVRFQRPTAVGLRENCLRFFSDLINGVTKAKDTLLCNLEGDLPPLINIKGQSVIINKQTKDYAEGTLTSYDKRLPVGAENITIFRRIIEIQLPAASQNASPIIDSSTAPANAARATPPVPSVAGRPALSTVQQATVGNQAPPPPPSREGRPNLTSAIKGMAVSAAVSTPLPPPPSRITPENLAALEQDHEPINLRPPLSSPPDDDPPPLPAKYQQPAPPTPPPPPLGKPISLNNGSTKASVTSQVNEQNLNELIQAVKLKKTEINPRQGQQAGLDLSPQDALLNKLMSMRKGTEGDGKKANDDEEWE